MRSSWRCVTSSSPRRPSTSEAVLGVALLNRFTEVQRRRETRGPRCVKHRGALLCLASAEELVPPLAKDVWTSAVIFETIPRLAALESRHDFDLSAVQISGLPGNDRPLTHTVTLRVARSLALARWRHSISSPRLIQRTPLSASAARYLIRSKFLPLAGAALPDAAAGAALQI